jgi:hypothetical protein
LALKKLAAKLKKIVVKYDVEQKVCFVQDEANLRAISLKNQE